MRVACYRTDPPSLVAALTDASLLDRYRAVMADEVKGLADRSLIAHIRRMVTLSSDVQCHGFESTARRDLAGADELLSELLAVATWHGWELPLESLGEQDLPLDDLPRGLLAADNGSEGARLWLIDGTTIALARSRESGDVAEMPH